MAAITEKVNKTSAFIASLSIEPAERFAIAQVLSEMYRFEMLKTFIPLESQKGE